MPNSFKNSRAKLLQQTLNFLWRQWTTLGVPGERGSDADWIIDPEALILITTEIGRYDARLLDSSIDWLNSYGRSINLQRLRRLQGQWPCSDERVLSGISEILSEQSTLRKWKLVREKFHFNEPPEPLFISKSDLSIPIFGDHDSRFEKYGLLRNEWKPRGTCQAPSPRQSENLIWSMRALFGVNARAEIFSWLLTHKSGHPAAIAKATGYFSKTIQITLNEMEQSGQIRSEKIGREKNFHLIRNYWNHLVPVNKTHAFPRWLNWPPIYYFIQRTLELLNEPEVPTARLRSIQVRGFLDEVAPSLKESRLLAQITANRDLTGEDLETAIVQDIHNLGTWLDQDFRELTIKTT